MNTHHDGAAAMTTNNDAIAPNSPNNIHARRSLLPRLAGLTLALAIGILATTGLIAAILPMLRSESIPPAGVLRED